LKAEHYCDVFQKKHGLEAVVFRLFNVYGSRQGFLGHSGVVTRFIESARRGLPLTIYGDGTQTRDFVHVADVAEAMSRALENSTADGETLNIGYGKPTSINELAEGIRTLMGTNVETIHEESMSGDVKRCFADISKSERFLGYKPEIALEDGLRGMLGEIPSNTFNRSAGS
jgi:UDP-glucose 4-epimerase